MLEFNDSLSVGNEVLDDDHKRLIDLCNKAFSAVGDGDNPQVVAEILDELIIYAQGHFQREEYLMFVCNYPEYGTHKSLHRDLEEQVNEYKDNYFRDPNLTSAGDIYKFLSDRLLQHIISEDLKYVSYLNN